jgi:dTDP-4-dehydrorhamnose reductase
MARLLVTGASGFLGWNICLAARVDYSVYGAHFGNPVGVEGVESRRVDLHDSHRLERAFREVEPDAVIHAAAVSDPNQCEAEPEYSHAINVAATKKWAELCAETKIPFIFTSTDLVFDGTRAPYRESDRTAPVSRYGRQKAEAEQLVLEAHPGAAVCRMPLMFGDAPAHASSFLQPTIEALRKGETLRLFTDEYRNPVSGASAARGLLVVLEKGYSGVLHLGGRDRVSRFEFGEMVCRIMAGVGRIEAVKQADILMAAARPADVSLCSDRAYSLGYDPPPIEQQIRALSCLQD